MQLKSSIFFILSIFTLLIISCRQNEQKNSINIEDLPLSTNLELSSSKPTVNLNEPVIFTATISPSLLIPNQPISGFVSFMEDDKIFCNNVPILNESNSASCHISFSELGQHVVLAVYHGDQYYRESKNSFIEDVIGKARVLTRLSVPSDTEVTAGETIILKANLEPIDIISVKSTTGTLTFKDGENNIEQCTHIQASFTEEAFCEIKLSTAGVHAFSATYSGDAFYDFSTSGIRNLNVNKIKTQIKLGIGDNLVRGQAVLLEAKIISGLLKPTGHVIFSSNGATIEGCSGVPVIESNGSYVANCKIETLLNAGEHTFKAQYSGDENNFGIPSELSRFVFIPTKVSIFANSEPFTVDREFDLSANIETADNPQDKNIAGYAKFFDGLNPIAGCENINVIKGMAKCSALKFKDSGTHNFFVYYSDNPQNQHIPMQSKALQISIGPEIPNSAIYIVTHTGKVSLSTNGGRSWMYTENQPAFEQVLSLFVTPMGDIYVGTGSGRIYYSTDKGIQWNTLPEIGEDSPVNALLITRNHELFVGLNNGSIKKLKLKESNTKWETWNMKMDSSINALVAYTSPHNVKDTTIIASHKNMIICKNTLSGQIHIFPFTRDITSMSLSGDDFGRVLYLGTSNGEIYHVKRDVNEQNFCPRESDLKLLSSEIDKSKTPQANSVTGLFITPGSGNLDAGVHTSPNFATLYISLNSKIAISKDNGLTWDFRNTPEDVGARSIFVTPVLYAVAGKRATTMRDIKISQNSGKNWYSMRSYLGESPERISLDAFFVTPQNGFLFTAFSDNIQTQIRTSVDGGLSWENQELFKSRFMVPETTLFVKFTKQRNDSKIEDIKLFLGHENGMLTIFDNTAGNTRTSRYNVCIKKVVDFYESAPVCRINSIQLSNTDDRVFLATYPDAVISEMFLDKNSHALKYFDVNKGAELSFAPNYLPVHSFTINQSLGIWYEGINGDLNGFTSQTSNLLRKSADAGIHWVEMSPPNGFSIPVSMHSLVDGTLFLSVIYQLDQNGTRRVRESKIYVSTDDGLIWEPLSNQPYPEMQAVSTIFAQYQYN